MYRAWPPKREPWEKSTPPASAVSISTSAAIVYERLRMFGATDSGISAPPG